MMTTLLLHVFLLSVIIPPILSENLPVANSALVIEKAEVTAPRSDLDSCEDPNVQTPELTACEEALQVQEQRVTQAVLEENRKRYDEALQKARQWLDGIKIDPTELRKFEHTIKGKKKLVELIDSYYRLAMIAEPSEKEKIKTITRERIKSVYEKSYHNMADISDQEFREDATSYMRGCYLLEKMGFDMSFYRTEMLKVLPRLNSHMRQRGSHQRMAFHWYYRYFGYKEPFDLAKGFEIGVIASRKDPYKLSWLEVYNLTHEVFVPYEYGEKLDANFFNPADRRYLRRAFNVLIPYFIKIDNPDILAELITCIRMLQMTDLSVYRDAILFLLNSQRPNGAFGNYEQKRAEYGDYVEINYYLHTTDVAIDALSMAFYNWEPSRPTTPK
jgi:hypothetical protein